MKDTEKLASFVANTGFEIIPPEAISVAKQAILDWFSVTVAGASEPASRAISEYVRRAGATAECGVICGGFRTSAEYSAWVNGTASHALDYDDTFANEAGFNFHPTVTVLPAVLALGEKIGAHGKDIISAYIVGIEVEYRIGTVIGRYISEAGWHPTPVVGTMGAAAAAANLLGLDSKHTLMALGIAASFAGGLVKNFGTMTKPMHAGSSARNGLIAAMLALEGFTANPEILEGETGFCSIFTSARKKGLDAEAEDLGKKWRIVSPGMSLKPYPCCRSTHASIDASIFLRNAAGIDPSKIRRIVCSTSPRHTELARFHRPETPYQAKFSIPYCIATAISRGKVVLQDFTEDKLKDPLIQDLLSRVEFQHPPEYTKNPMSLAAEIKVLLKDGREYCHRVEVPSGDASNPMREEELLAKLHNCMRICLSDTEVEDVLGILRNLESLAEISPLIDRLTFPKKA